MSILPSTSTEGPLESNYPPIVPGTICRAWPDVCAIRTLAAAGSGLNSDLTKPVHVRTVEPNGRPQSKVFKDHVITGKPGEGGSGPVYKQNPRRAWASAR